MLKNHAAIALVGDPNSGKTTLFNALTGAQQQTGNWAGVTVELLAGTFCADGQSLEIIDLPGTYTLTQFPFQSAQDEYATTQFLRASSYSCLLNVVDRTHLERNLYVTLQCLEQNVPVIIALSRMDLVKKDEKRICFSTLSQLLGCPIFPISARSGMGLEPLKQALFIPPKVSQEWKVDYPPAIENAVLSLQESYQAEVNKPLARFQALCYLEGEALQEAPQTKENLVQIKAKLEKEIGMSSDVAIAKARYDFIEGLLLQAALPSENEAEAKENKLTQVLDKIVCHRYLGFPIFLAAMYSLFFFAIKVGGTFQDYIEQAAHFVFVEQMSAFLSYLQAPESLIAILAYGMGEGITTVLTFVPVIGAMFFALAFFEDIGYMARAAFVVDRLMRAIGLPGKSFVPMIVGFGCNVPAIMGMRTLENRRDRILAVMMSPFMSCGARLAIFTVFVAAFFPQGGQNVVFALYAVGVLMAVLTGWLLKKTLLKGEPSPLLLEMPEYVWPHAKTLLLHVWHRLKRFILNAGKLIVVVCTLMGVLNHVTLEGEWFPDTQQSSLLAEVGKKMTPIFRPMGIEEENWPAAVGLLTGILAKEVVVGTLNSLYAQSSDNQPVYGEMVKRFNGQRGAFAYLLFVLLYFPCISATAAMLREVQRRWTIFAVCWTTGLAYGIAVAYYQAATFFVHPVQSGLWLVSLTCTGALAFWGIRRYGQRRDLRSFPTPIVLN
jgi:ferrous iron transport protein B